MAPRGYVALVLHSHLPFLRHPEPALEERWYFEAVVECYLPLLEVVDNLVADGVDFALTVSLSPTLVAMFDDPVLKKRTHRHLESLVELGEREKARTHGDPLFAPLAEFYHARFKHCLRLYTDTYRADLAGAFKRLADTGRVELITCAGTHPYLPLLKTEEGRRAQVQVAVDFFRRRFGRACRGFWLPECGYAPGLDYLLARHGLRYFVVDTHAFLHADPSPPAGGPYRPLALPSGVVAFARDPECAAQVWNRLAGYPGDPDYREFYRDIGYDLPADYLAPYLPNGVRVDTGFKYYRITGATAAKEPYNPAAATARAETHAGNFLFNREHQIAYLAERLGKPPIVVAPYDTELFGHWWFEGPQWLDFVCRKAAEQNVFRLTTLGRYLDQYPPEETGRLGLTSWGEGGYNRVWLNPSNDWLYRHLHAAEEEMVEEATARPRASGATARILDQMARELMLAQSSDWAFILNAGTATEYAISRLGRHLERFHRLRRQLVTGPEEEYLASLEAEDNLFPHLSYHLYRRQGAVAVGAPAAKGAHPAVLVLTWEYPPRVVGGIAPHVYDLSRALAELGAEVHVLTIDEGNRSSYESAAGVHVYRLAVWPQSGPSFRDWVFQFNLVMLDFLAGRLASGKPPWQVVHAHDWLVSFAAVTAASRYSLPLVATIHATEYGRNRGLHTPEQQAIHASEAWLVEKAERVICCSHYMHGEIQALFNPPPSKVVVIPNGVNLPRESPAPLPDWVPQGQLILFVGRLVVEKGVQVLLQALPAVLAAIPGAHLVVAGAGPHAEDLQRLAHEPNIAARVTFTGFLSAPLRDSLLRQAAVAVFPSLYEPFGIVALEAMAAGCPTVVAASGGLAETVTDGHDGLVVPPGDAAALAGAITRILLDPALALRLGENARRTVQEKYAWSDIARATLAVYRSVAPAFLL